MEENKVRRAVCSIVPFSVLISIFFCTLTWAFQDSYYSREIELFFKPITEDFL